MRTARSVPLPAISAPSRRRCIRGGVVARPSAYGEYASGRAPRPRGASTPIRGRSCGSRYFALVLALPSLARAYDLEWKVDGYYRARFVYEKNVANVLDEASRITSENFLVQRARIEPRLQLGKIAKLQITADVLDDVVWGDNNARLAAPLFAINPSETDLNGQTVPTVQIKRAWIEMNLPIGQLRVGRMPSHWGMGLLANGGGTSGCEWAAPDAASAADARCLDPYFVNDFGDSHFGSVNDRILFATRPLQIVKTLLGARHPESDFIVAYAYDRLVQDYFNVAYDRQLRARIDNGLAHNTNLTGTDAARGYGESAFLRNSDSRVAEHIVVLLYNNPRWMDHKRASNELRGGAYLVFRSQDASRLVCGTNNPTTDPMTGEPTYSTPPCGPAGPGDIKFAGDGSFVGIYDLWYRLRYQWLYSEAEGYWIKGHTDGGVPIGDSSTLKKDASIKAFAARAGYSVPLWDGIFELGYASGDDNILDKNFTQRPIHADYNVGLLLYEDVLRELTARTIGRLQALGGYIRNSRSLQSNGGVINSWYIFPRVKWRPARAPGLELLGGVLAAWVDQQGFNPFLPTRCPSQGDLHCLDHGIQETKVGTFLGWEVDGGIKYWWADEHLYFTLEAGYLRFGDALRRANWGLSPSDALRAGVNGAATVQSRIAFVF